MPSASSPIPPLRGRQARSSVNDPYQSLHGVSGSGGSGGPSWTFFNTIVTLGLGLICGLIGIVYVNVKEDIRGLRDDGKDARAAQFQTNRDISDLRVAITKMGTQVDQVLQRLQAQKP